MGFRNPITTASAVDTRASVTAAGARVYTRPIPGRTDGSVQGVLEFDDGLPGSPTVLTSQPGNERDNNGGTVTLTGGTFGDGYGSTVQLPNLTVDALPGGAAALAGVPLPAGAKMGRRALITGADVFVVPAGTQVQADGVPIVCASKAARDAITWTKGGQCIRADLGGLQQRYDGAAWRFATYGTASGTTDASGLLSFPHGIPDGQAPVVWEPILLGQSTDAQTLVTKLVAWAQDATNLTVRVERTDTNAYFPGNPTRLAWVAYF